MAVILVSLFLTLPLKNIKKPTKNTAGNNAIEIKLDELSVTAQNTAAMKQIIEAVIEWFILVYKRFSLLYPAKIKHA